MKKTTVYLSDDEAAGLRRLAAETGRRQAELLRDAVAEYVARHSPSRTFECAGVMDSGRGRASSIADDIEERLAEGFGRD